ncbi:unnamed protein product [Porites evermanni]|uniref:Uncharacterized protein n=1 Tax=Porites evermanni TaxID=104178 RepID=A0ABN8Q3I6_9CNID|nr:unnamed protein product [Porites evermanni]
MDLGKFTVFAFLLNLGILATTVEGISYQVGKLNASETRRGWNCNSGCEAPQHCTLPRCTNVVFPQTFSGSGTVRVFVSLSHEDQSSVVHSPSAVWAESISTAGFQLCSRATGSTNDTGIINWVAFQDKPMLTHGSVTFSGIWTTETKCEKVAFSQSFASKPRVFVSVKYTRSTKPNDAMYLWLENVNSGGFEVCLREFLPFDGKHQDAVVDWFAFTGNGSQLNFTITGEEIFPNSGNPSAKNNYGFCQEVPFNTTFYKSPVVILSVNHEYNLKVKGSRPPENNIISAWLEEVGLESMKVCVKDLSGLGSSHDPLIVSYAVTGDLNPCLNVHCPRFGVCRTYSAHDARCECDDQCPSYKDPVCTANGTTYDNRCWHKLSYCGGLENNLVYHPGSCEGLGHLKKKLFRLLLLLFLQGKFAEAPIVLVTSEHLRTGKEYDAALIWIEDVTKDSVKVCLREMQNFDGRHQDITVVRLGHLKKKLFRLLLLLFLQGKFAEAPIVLVTSEHLRTGKEYDAALIWIEDVTKDSVKVCLREMQNFDGRHQDITVNWFAFSKLHKPLFTEHGDISFPNTNPPLDKMNNAYCQFVSFTRAYNSIPTVLLSANHSTTVSGNSAPIHNGITTWIENMNTSGFRACVKELYANRYDPLSVGYAVLTDICEPGWNYFNGFCYFTSKTCQNWTTALNKCRKENSVLVDVQNNEENVFLQHLHNGAKSWLGLNDIFTEGSFTWADRGSGNSTAWAKNQPNNFRDEDCVHTLGVEYKYEWNDVKCSDCHQYTCKKDLNECSRDKYYCDQVASCTNYRGSFNCTCDQGYFGDGFECELINYASMIRYKIAALRSTIVGNDANYLQYLSTWLKPVAQSKSSKWKRCWRASVDGWAASTFHSGCDNKGPTVTIIRVGGKYIFGGYTSLSWGYSCQYRYDSQAFLFSLVNKPGLAPVKLPAYINYAYAVYDCSSYFRRKP